MVSDPMEGLLRRADLVWSILDRTERARRLGEWGLLYRVMPDNTSRGPDRVRLVPDKGSSLALDDNGFMPEIARLSTPDGEPVERPALVSSTARFPAMAAAENLVGAAQVEINKP